MTTLLSIIYVAGFLVSIPIMWRLLGVMDDISISEGPVEIGMWLIFCSIGIGCFALLWPIVVLVAAIMTPTAALLGFIVKQVRR